MTTITFSGVTFTKSPDMNLWVAKSNDIMYVVKQGDDGWFLFLASLKKRTSWSSVDDGIVFGCSIDCLRYASELDTSFLRPKKLFFVL